MVYLIENDIDDYLDINNNSFLISVKYSYELKIGDLEIGDFGIYFNKKKYKIIHFTSKNGIRNITIGSVDSFWYHDVIMMEKL